MKIGCTTTAWTPSCFRAAISLSSISDGASTIFTASLMPSWAAAASMPATNVLAF
jgi:hypothetical protein